MKHTLKTYFNFLILLTFSLQVNAADSLIEPYWEISFLGGPAILHAQNTVLEVTNIESDKTFQKNQGNWKYWTAELGLGYAIPLYGVTRYSNQIQWFPIIEPQINAYYLQGNVEGNVRLYYQYPSNLINDYTIEFDSTRLMFDAALTFFSWHTISVNGIAGIGPSWNRVGYSSKQAEHCDEVFLDKHTRTNFAYEFGGSINYSLSEPISFSVEYLYTGFNNVALSKNGHVGNNRILSGIESSAFNLNSQAVLFGIRFRR